MTFVATHVNRSLMLMGCLTPRILLPFLMRGQALKRDRVHLKVPGWLSDSSALLTAKFPMLLSRLKDTSCNKMPLSNMICWLIFKQRLPDVGRCDIQKPDHRSPLRSCM